MNKRHMYILAGSLVLSLVFVVVGWITESSVIKWAAPAVGLALIALGLGINSILIAVETNKRMINIDITLTQIKGLQEEIQKEQKEQGSTGPPIVASLQAMSQYYMDYIKKQKEEDNK